MPCVLPVRAKYLTDVSYYNGSEDSTDRFLELNSVGSKMEREESEIDAESPRSYTFAQMAILSPTRFPNQTDICPWFLLRCLALGGRYTSFCIFPRSYLCVFVS